MSEAYPLSFPEPEELPVDRDGSRSGLAEIVELDVWRQEPREEVRTNLTGLEFDNITEQELVDYIGERAIQLGINLKLVWSEEEGICYQFESYDDIDNMNELFDEREAEAAEFAGREIDQDRLTEIFLFDLREVESPIYAIDESRGLIKTEPTINTYRLESKINEQQYQAWGGRPSVHKKNFYYLAGFLKRKCMEGSG